MEQVYLWIIVYIIMSQLCGLHQILIKYSKVSFVFMTMGIFSGILGICAIALVTPVELISVCSPCARSTRIFLSLRAIPTSIRQNGRCFTRTCGRSFTPSTFREMHVCHPEAMALLPHSLRTSLSDLSY